MRRLWPSRRTRERSDLLLYIRPSPSCRFGYFARERETFSQDCGGKIGRREECGLGTREVRETKYAAHGYVLCAVSTRGCLVFGCMAWVVEWPSKEREVPREHSPWASELGRREQKLPCKQLLIFLFPAVVLSGAGSLFDRAKHEYSSLSCGRESAQRSTL